MALGTATLVADQRKSASAPLGIARISFAGDGSYPTGGTADFQDYVQAAIGRDVSVISVDKAASTGAYTAIYDAANDKLYVETAAGVQVGNGVSLAGTTFILNVYYQ
jgi:hypothetical protein